MKTHCAGWLDVLTTLIEVPILIGLIVFSGTYAYDLSKHFSGKTLRWIVRRGIK